jgi:uncharacterized protein (TIGR00369 family)
VTDFADLVRRWRGGETELAPITALLGVRPVSLGDGEAEVEMIADARHHNAMGTVHGGVFLDLADVAMGVALATLLDAGEGFATVGANVAYLRPVRQARLTAAARVVHRGRTTAHLECEVTDADGRPVARVTSICSLLAPR